MYLGRLQSRYAKTQRGKDNARRRCESGLGKVEWGRAEHIIQIRSQMFDENGFQKEYVVVFIGLAYDCERLGIYGMRRRDTVVPYA